MVERHYANGQKHANTVTFEVDFSGMQMKEIKFVGLASSHSWGGGELYGCDKAEPHVLLSLIVKIYQIFSNV